jgi:leucyl-tRNA synthetase
MSKSKNNGVDPQSLIDQYGADTARLFIMFAAPPEMTLEWSDSGVQGTYRFLRRLWEHGSSAKFYLNPDGARPKTSFSQPFDWSKASLEQTDLRRKVHALLKRANFDYARRQFNTVVSAGMQMLNLLHPASIPGAFLSLDGNDDVNRHSSEVHDWLLWEGTGILLRMLSPIVPHIMHALWRELGYGDDILTAPWPEADELALIQDSLEIVVQVNGKLRGRVTVPVGSAEDKVREIAMADEAVARHVSGKVVKKVIVVPGKLVNIVVAG